MSIDNLVLTPLDVTPSSDTLVITPSPATFAALTPGQGHGDLVIQDKNPRCTPGIDGYLRGKMETKPSIRMESLISEDESAVSSSLIDLEMGHVLKEKHAIEDNDKGITAVEEAIRPEHDWDCGDESEGEFELFVEDVETGEAPQKAEITELDPSAVVDLAIVQLNRIHRRRNCAPLAPRYTQQSRPRPQRTSILRAEKRHEENQVVMPRVLGEMNDLFCDSPLSMSPMDEKPDPFGEASGPRAKRSGFRVSQV